MFYIQTTNHFEGSTWHRTDEEFETVLEALEERDELSASIDNAERCNSGTAYRVVDDDGTVYEYQTEEV